MVIDLIAYFVMLVLAFPIGYWLAYLCKDELVKGREWFRRLMVWSFVLALVSFIFWTFVMGLSFMFILIVAGVSYHKSRDKKFVK